jgi:hypothetical protein
VLAYSTRGAAIADTTAEHAIGTPITAPAWAGFSLLADNTALASPLTAAFDDAQIWTPAGTRPFTWYVYRDPALGGIADIEGATMQLAKQGPAHAYVSAITQLSVLCDDTDTGCDAGPMGAI